MRAEKKPEPHTQGFRDSRDGSPSSDQWSWWSKAERKQTDWGWGEEEKSQAMKEEGNWDFKMIHPVVEGKRYTCPQRPE